ncbi:MAG: hypothetical protein HUU37_10385 [Bdellovibrionales bacterium]|nr:hypothetical protein [Bdellovibrionales bacterium]
MRSALFLALLLAPVAYADEGLGLPQALWRTVGDIDVSDLTADLGSEDDPFPVFVTAHSGEAAEAGRTVFEKHRILEAGSLSHLCLQKQVREMRDTAPRLVPLLRSLNVRGLEISVYMGHSAVGDREYQWTSGAQSIYSSVWLNTYVDRPAAVVSDEANGRRLQVRILVSSVDDEQAYQKRLQWERGRMREFGRKIPRLEVFGCNVARMDAVVAKVRSVAEKRLVAGTGSRFLERHLDAFNAWYGAAQTGERMPASRR